MKIIANTFVKRQTANSRFSYFDGSWDELEDIVRSNSRHFSPGYRAGVMLVHVPPDKFFSSVVNLKEGDVLVGGFEPRRKGEAPRKYVTTSTSRKTPAKTVDIVLYSSAVLSEDHDNELPVEDGNWEIISINASPLRAEMPINPNVLMHNHFGSDGGTATNLSDSEFVAMLRESFLYWNDKAMAGDSL